MGGLEFFLGRLVLLHGGLQEFAQLEILAFDLGDALILFGIRQRLTGSAPIATHHLVGIRVLQQDEKTCETACLRQRQHLDVDVAQPFHGDVRASSCAVRLPDFLHDVWQRQQ